jgi:hypothetical protein
MMTVVVETCSEFLWKNNYFYNKTFVFDWIVFGILDLTAAQRDVIFKDANYSFLTLLNVVPFWATFGIYGGQNGPGTGFFF